MNKYRFVFFLAFYSLITSCSRHYDEIIVDHIEASCDNFDDQDYCIISLCEVTDFEWEEVYIFDDNWDSDEISKLLGFSCDCSGVDEGNSWILFINNNEIVRVDDYSRFSRVQFRKIKDLADKPKNYSMDNARFYVLKEQLSSKWYFYDLYPISNKFEPKYEKTVIP